MTRSPRLRLGGLGLPHRQVFLHEPTAVRSLLVVLVETAEPSSPGGVSENKKKVTKQRKKE